MSTTTQTTTKTLDIQERLRALDEGTRIDAEAEQYEARYLRDLERVLAELAEAGNLTAQQTKTGHSIVFERGSDLVTRDYPAPQWAVDGLIPERGVVAIAGEPKTQKTWIGLELAMAVATGSDAFGQFGTRAAGRGRPVFCLLVESTEREFRNRARALAKSRGLDPVKATENLYVAALRAVDLGDPNALAGLVLAIRAQCPEGIGMLLLDPLRDLHTAEENDSSSMAPIMGALRSLRHERILDCPVVFIHHSSKAGTDGKVGRRRGQNMRGSSVIHATVDAGIYPRPASGGDGQCSFVLDLESETRNGRGAGRFTLRLELDDDEMREAVDARWVFSRSKSEDTDPTMAAVLGFLRATPGGVTGRAIADGIGKHKNTVAARLKTAEADGLVVRDEDGFWHARPD